MRWGGSAGASILWGHLWRLARLLRSLWVVAPTATRLPSWGLTWAVIYWFTLYAEVWSLRWVSCHEHLKNTVGGYGRCDLKKDRVAMVLRSTQMVVPKSEKMNEQQVLQRLMGAWEEFRRGELSANASGWLVPYDSLEVQRPMRHWGKSIGLSPGTPGVPRPDFHLLMTCNLEDQDAFLRQEAGALRTSLRNLVKGRRVTSTTEKLLEPVTFWMSEANAADALKGLHSSPTLPPLLLLSELLDGFLLSAFLIHCRANENSRQTFSGEVLLDESWWTSHGVGLTLAECRFVDRLLIVIAMRRHVRFGRSPDVFSKVTWEQTKELAGPDHHPIGNWLNVVKHASGASSWVQLAARVPFAVDNPRSANEHRLRKWASGSEWLPQARALELCRGVRAERSDALEALLQDARRFALVLEFLQAADRNGQRLSSKTLRSLLTARVEMVGMNAASACSKLAPLLQSVTSVDRTASKHGIQSH